jgi:hypothetical protein
MTQQVPEIGSYLSRVNVFGMVRAVVNLEGIRLPYRQNIAVIK